MPHAAMKRRALSMPSAMASNRRPSGDSDTNCWFQAWIWLRSAKPPLVKARSRLRVATDWW